MGEPRFDPVPMLARLGVAPRGDPRFGQEQL